MAPVGHFGTDAVVSHSVANVGPSVSVRRYPARMASRPPDLPPEPALEIGLARRTLRVLIALLVPVGVAGAAGVFALLMLAFGADAGQRDPERAGRMATGVMVSIGLFAVCGIPAAFAVVAPPHGRKRWWWTCGAIAALSIVGAVTCFALYLGAVAK